MLRRIKHTKLISVLYLIVVVCLFLNLSTISAEEWIGKKFMPKIEAKFIKGVKDDTKIPAEEILFPLIVSKIDGDLLLVGAGWIKKSHVIPLDDAISYYTDYLKTQNLLSSWAYMNRGIVWSEQKESSKAISNAINDFAWATRLNPYSSLAYHYEGLLWLSRREYDTAIMHFNDAIRLYPKNPMTYYYRGNANYSKGARYTPAYDRALKDYNKSIELDPKYSPAYHQRGMTWFTKGDYDKALKDYTMSIQLDSKDAYAHYNRGIAWSKIGKYNKAIKDFSKSIQLDPKFMLAYNARGNTWSKLGKYDKSIKDQTVAMRLDPFDVVIIVHRGNSWDLKGAYKEALLDYNKSVRLHPQRPDGYNGLAWLWATCPDIKYRDGKKAVEAGKKACEFSDWKEPNFIDTLAAAYAESGDFEQAVKYQKMLLKMLNESADKRDFEERLELYLAGKPYHRKKPEKLSK
ncbi:tetratricopeptide repeat protein [Gimesia aquarii]|uniref:TPR repeat-containing protein YrrB n=1 Tax=Gimesia aquarii TaxID=2527964 RepID=A0A517VYH6_9PLAN|nr:tetratricopeptide repeat protein [Gimesia aquarii]QDT98040.1 TPR repeat-containing protein YrrB [Gimesia aquarii]